MIDHLPWPAILGGFGDSLLELAEALCQVRGETDVMADGRFALQYIDEVDKKSGAPGVIRTPDLLVRSQTLYPAELWAHRWRADFLNVAAGRRLRKSARALPQ